MVIDLFWVIVSVVATVGFFVLGEPNHSLAWSGVVIYSGMNLVENRLRHSGRFDS